MIGFILVFNFVVLMLFFGLLLRLYYTFSRKAALKFNTEFIVKRVPNLFFTCSTQYANFSFQPDYSNIDQLPEQYLLISNHQSVLDIVVYMKYYNGSRLRFIAKKELEKNVPLVSLMLKTGKHCMVQRSGSPTLAMKAIDKFAKYVKENNLIPVLFPEGTRTRDGKLRTFHAAGFRRLLNTAPMPVAVFALDGGWEMATMKQMMKNIKNGYYKVKLLKVYDAPKNKAEQVQILTEAKELIQAQLDEWRK